ncbi:MAG: IPT/TIG domain-containing protein [Desulfobacteraceae bacterium]|nr:IPT/TIG domain-containing protein [Desulfobacteraceae bacterium]
MRKKSIAQSISLTATIILGAAVCLWAAVPPPPVNQNLFIYDTSFGNFTLADCHECHGTDATLAVTHHALLNSTPVPSCINASGTLPSTLATGCHILSPSSSGGFSIQDPTNCFNCHNQSPHHTTTFAAAQDCKHCHGAAVDNTNDGHYIPSYPMNTGAGGVTPGPVGRTVSNPANPATTIIVQGCAACHQASPSASPRPISDNQTLHHGTGIGQGDPGSIGTCQWCHGTGSNSFTIRGCEACHGVNSLHNIQYDSPASANLGTIIPGQENLGYGHIGNNWDCQGCHWSWTGTAASDTTTATVPAISSLSSKVVALGKAATLTINGNSFINDNTSGTTTYKPVVTLTNDGNTITLTPFSTTVSEVKVVLPTTLKQGVYDLRVDKTGTISNLAKLVVAPEVAIKTAVLSSQTLTITGAGFGSAPTAEFKKQLGVFINNTQARTISWSDNKIVATSPIFGGGKTVTVNTLFGPATSTIFAAGKKVR